MPTMVFGVIIISGQAHAQQTPLLRRIMRGQPEQRDVDYRAGLLKQAAFLERPGDVKVLDVGFEVGDLMAVRPKGFVLRIQSTCTDHRYQLPRYSDLTLKPEKRTRSQNTYPRESTVITSQN